MNMRVLIVLLMFAIGFSGFSTAAHAFADLSCDSTSGQQMEAGIECPDHQMVSSEKGASGDLAGKAQCLDCLHCCSGHVHSMPFAAAAIVQAATLHVTYTALTDRIDGDYAFSLLRPPQFAA